MSKPNKGHRTAPKQNMNNPDQSTQAPAELKVATESATQDQQQPDAETPVADQVTKAPAVAEQPAQTEQQPETQTNQIVVGSVVPGTTSVLGAAAPAEKVREIISQKPVAQPQDVSKFEKKLNEVKADGTALEKMIVTTLEAYVKTMAPGVINEEQVIHRAQMQLWNVLKNTLEAEENFDNNWKLVISFFRQYRDGALGGSSPFRGLDSIKGISAEQNQAFMNVINLLIVTAGLTNKKDVSKHTRLDKSIHSIFKESVRQRVINYYV